MKKLFGLILAAFVMTGSLFAQNAYSPEIIKGFADSLYADGFSKDAELQYKLYFYLQKDKKYDETAVLNINHIYFTSNNLNGINWLNLNISPYVRPVSQEFINYAKAKILFSQRKDNEFNLFYKTLLNETHRLELLSTEWKLLYAISYDVMQKDIALAEEVAAKASLENEVFAPIVVACQNYKLKSPALAGTLSAIVPGTGQWYAGEFFTGFAELVGLAVSTWGTIYYAKENGIADWHPWVYGSLATFFYIQNISDAVMLTKGYNNRKYYKVRSSVERAYEELY